MTADRAEKERERLHVLEERIRGVLDEQRSYRFSPQMDSVSRAYLDLSLEIEDVGDLGRLAVLVPRVVQGWHTALYLAEGDGELRLAAATLDDFLGRMSAGERITVAPLENTTREEGQYLIPLLPRAADPSSPAGAPVLGMLVLYPEQALGAGDLFFMRKYANLVSLSLARGRLAQKNRQHILFIRKLVADIGHNVIVPNIFFKVYLRRLAGKVDRMAQIRERMAAMEKAPPQVLPQTIRDLRAELTNVNEGILEEFENIQKHYISTSLYLETLLRQSHFEQGRYVLQKKPCNFRRDIINPQIERFLPRLKEREIEIDLSAGGVPDEYFEAVVDVGLISQVYANLISNAVKYTRAISSNGRIRKFIAYGMELIPGAFGMDLDGVKLNLFSTGPPLKMDDVSRIFEEGYRGGNVETERGTGHGLFFVREVVELHGGRVGYEPTEMGNNFYFILPK
jgi:signal transduction histidine kinase